MTILLSAIYSCIYAQGFPEEPINGIAFPIGSKVTIKLHATDSAHYDFSIIELKAFNEIVNTQDHDYLFPENGEEDRITFYFCQGTHGDTREEKEKNRRVLLLMKNYSRKVVQYSFEIQQKKNEEFEYTSNSVIYAGAIALEMWPFMLYAIRLSKFQKYNPD